ncbi:MAG: 4-hydroxy-tetrahydrodipicolinate synthase [candidate division WOR-3 bacterium]
MHLRGPCSSARFSPQQTLTQYLESKRRRAPADSPVPSDLEEVGMLSGCITALVTPFRNGRLDIAGFRRNVRFQIRNGVSGLLVAGSTGESPTLTAEEKERLLDVAKAEVDGSGIPVVAGVGTNDTARSVEQARAARKAGADALLVVAPYYNKPTTEGLFLHFRAVAEATELPNIIYNIPGRSGVNIAPATIERLCRSCSNIVAVKEASGSLDQTTEILCRCGNRVTVLSGDDSLTLPILAAGGKGVISVVSNIVPGDTSSMVEHFLAGRLSEAQRLHWRLFALIKVLFIESNPIPVKAAMEILGMAAGEPRLPLCRPSDEHLAIIRQALVDYGLLDGSRR